LIYKKSVPLGGGVKTTVVAFLVYVCLFDFPRGLGKSAKESESRKIAHGEIAAWQGFDPLYL
jgi:hypothetical protein